MNKTALILLSVGTITLSAFAALKESSRIALRFIGVEEACKSLEEKLGKDAAGAVDHVDARTNSLTIDESHAQAAKVREFFGAVDVRPTQMIVHAVISRQVPATATKDAYEEIISRPTVVARQGERIVLQVPGQDGATKIELRIESTAGEKK